ncbi:MAG: tetratricopeptide repeat protein [Lachnospiraceae bacterium]|nr:tetratricopeptide repeat protein [Lachnospiraceae bacterium]
MKKIIFSLWIVSLVLFILVLSGYKNNKKFIDEYKSHNYIEEKIAIQDILKPYVKLYNNGNSAYKNKDYDKAISLYDEALSKHPSHKNKSACKIRYNKALAMLQMLLSEEENSMEKDEMIKRLNDIKAVLLEEGCADDNNSGHDNDCQILKNYIDQLINQVNNGSGSSGDSKDDNKQQDPQTKSKEEQLKDRQKEGQKNRISKSSDLPFEVDDIYFDGDSW